jgi:hypothetical protein
LYNQGSAKIAEDGIIFNPPRYFGVTDGVSGIYTPDEGPKLFKGKTGGQLASYAISYAFKHNLSPKPLKYILRTANYVLGELNKRNGLSFDEPELLPSATFCIASIDNQKIEIVQGGDTLAVWQMKDGTIGGTPNLIFDYEQRQTSRIAELMKKHKGNRQKMWEEFRPSLIEDRRKTINASQGFAIINGQPWFEDFIQEFLLPRKDVKRLIIFSDGLVPFEATEDPIAMATFIFAIYQNGGLNRVLKSTREYAKENKKSSHEDYPEATAIAIEF